MSLREKIRSIVRIATSPDTGEATINIAADQILKAFSAELERIEKQKKVCNDCEHDDKNLESEPYIPLSVIQQARKELEK